MSVTDTRVIAIANQKGGCGKTTIAMHLAGALARRIEGRVLVVDADIQGSAVRWAASADESHPFPAHIAGLAAAGGHVHREVRKFQGAYAAIFVDCPPAVASPVPQSALMVADLVLVPVVPSPPDVWAAIGIRELVERMADINPSLAARIVPNMVANTVMARDAIDALQELQMPLTKTQIGSRTAFRHAATFGTIVHDLKDQLAIGEIDRLLDEVLDLVSLESARREGR